MRLGAAIACAVLAATPAVGHAQQESRDEAWWTGPMLAPSGATLPQGHVLIEPYLYDVMTDATFDASGGRHRSDGGHELGSLTYVLYGVTDDVTAGVLPRFGFNEPAGAANSSGVGLGDLTVQAGYGLTHYEDGQLVPATELVVQETVPTGQYDHLSRASDGLGAGVYTTALALYSQDYFWMPNGRILRARLDLSYALSASASVRDLSVYATTAGFRGRVYPGDSFMVDAAGEYSLTRSWVLALDIVYQHGDNTRVSGTLPGPAPAAAPAYFESDSGSSDSLGFAPAIEYNWSSRIGVLLGVRIICLGRNSTASVTPAVAVNLVH